MVIGVERYRERLPAAEFAAADARLMARYLTRVLGYPEENVALLVDEQVTKSAFKYQGGNNSKTHSITWQLWMAPALQERPPPTA